MDKEIIIDRLLGKKNCEIHSNCVSIFELFDPPDANGIPDFPVSTFLSEATVFDQFIERIKKEKDKDLRELLEFRLQNIAFDIAFGFGFVFGHMFDIPNAKVQKNIEAIKKVIKERKLLPYLPREKERRETWKL